MPSFRQRLTTDPAAKPDSVDRICAVFKGTGLDPDSERHLHLFGRVNVGGDLPLKGLTLLERTLFRSAVAGLKKRTCNSLAGTSICTVDPVLPPEVLAAVSPLKHNGKTVGTGFRVDGTCLFVCPRRCAVDGGTCLEGLTAFNEPLTFKEAYPRLDTIVFEGPPGPGLPLSSRPLVPGTPLWLVSFALGLDEEVKPPDAAQGRLAPAVSAGTVFTASRCGDWAAADCYGPPDSSGGPIVMKFGNRYEAVGSYEGISHHFDGSTTSGSSCGDGSNGGVSGGGGSYGGSGERSYNNSLGGGGDGSGGGYTEPSSSNSSTGGGGGGGGRGEDGGSGNCHRGVPMAVVPPEVETSPTNMFEFPDEGSTASRSDRPEVIERLARMAVDDIPHKPGVGLFATSAELLRCMDHLIPGSDTWKWDEMFSEAAATPLRSGKRRLTES